MATTQFGTKEALMNRTPGWATWIFRVVFLLTTVASFLLGADSAIPEDSKVRIILYLKGLDMLVYGLAKLCGVSVKEEGKEQ